MQGAYQHAPIGPAPVPGGGIRPAGPRGQDTLTLPSPARRHSVTPAPERTRHPVVPGSLEAMSKGGVGMQNELVWNLGPWGIGRPAATAAPILQAQWFSGPTIYGCGWTYGTAPPPPQVVSQQSALDTEAPTLWLKPCTVSRNSSV